ncbi:pyroglutamyl-peptidase I [Bacillus sp. FJAT-45066]|uniref:pyroglutamyl-peptidase I n=1 Tax=Bacillus sp. FJAT-45066 TaxID=2011010 RepID=UPI000BB920E6|nr:pyroglutamyl-peptidase I [Bacillus sp. FJAT-45066]
MKKLLLTGFVPFLQFPVNPTEEIAKALDGTVIGEYEIHSRVLPVDFAESATQLLAYYDELQPDAVISLGLAAGRAHITPERIAINCKDGEPDNTGKACEDELIETDGPDGYFSTLPIRAMVNTLKENGYPAKISNSAGTYLCNNVMYATLHKIASSSDRSNVRAGFIHIPASHELALKLNNSPSWSQQDLTNAIKLAIQTL